MYLIDWTDFYGFIILFLLFTYVLVFNPITTLHKAYLILHMMMMLWPLGQFALSMSANFHINLLLIDVSFIGIVFTGYGWLIFSFILTRKFYKLTRMQLVYYSIPAILSSILTTTNPWHHLFINPIVQSNLTQSYGPLFWITGSLGCTYLLAAVIFMINLLRSDHGSTLKKQIYWFFTGCIILFVFVFSDIWLNVILESTHIAGLTTMGIILSDLIFIMAVQRYNIFRIISIAHRDVIDTMQIGIVMLDTNDVVIDVNEGMKIFLQVEQGKSLDLQKVLVHLNGKYSERQFLDKYVDHPKDRWRTEAVLNNDQHVSIYISPILNEKQTFLGRIITFYDITEVQHLLQQMNEKNEKLYIKNFELQKAKEELSFVNAKLEQLAIRDSLTGCYNRRYFFQQLEREVIVQQRYGNPFTILMLDVDHFKAINDSYGHPLGDDVLKYTTKLVNEILRQSDIFARYGGEEFMIFMPYTNMRDGTMIAERIRRMVEESSYQSQDARITITISIGLVSVENFEEMTDTEQYVKSLVQYADDALYEAKNKGRNCMVVADLGKNEPMD